MNDLGSMRKDPAAARAALAKRHPRYGFDSHVGYATPEHLQALDEFGALKRVHRQFFEPVYRLNQEKMWPQRQ